MIKLFRKVRQKFLGESNFRKYFAYAFGEIFLVVIGILIALQVNNWNESRKLIDRQKEYLVQLTEDIRQLNTYYTGDKNNVIKNEEIALKGLRYIENCDPKHPDRRYLDSLLLSHQVLSWFFNIHDTYDEMVSANVLAGLQDQELKASIKDFYTSIEYANSFIDYFRTELGRASAIIWRNALFSYDARGELTVQYELENLCDNVEFRNALVEVVDARKDFGGSFMFLLDKINKLKTQLESTKILSNE